MGIHILETLIKMGFAVVMAYLACQIVLTDRRVTLERHLLALFTAIMVSMDGAASLFGAPKIPDGFELPAFLVPAYLMTRTWGNPFRSVRLRRRRNAKTTSDSPLCPAREN